jgi:ribosomal protein S18 acetylase RimI-like enzyme
MPHTVCIKLRPAQGGDLPFLESLRLSTMWEVVERHYPWESSVQLQRIYDHLECAQIITSDQLEIGLLKVHRTPSEIHLIQIQLLPGYQNQGVGSSLIMTLQQESLLSGRPITLKVFKSNRACRLYQRLGFTPFAEDEHRFHLRWDPETFSADSPHLFSISSPPEVA